MKSPQNQNNSTRKFAVFDIDGTLIRWQLYHAIVEALSAKNSISKASSEAIAAAQLLWKKRSHENSFREYEVVLIQEYHKALSSVQAKDYELAVKEAFDAHKDHVYVYTRDLIKSLKEQGYLLFAVSGSQQEAVELIGEYYGFDAVIGSIYRRQENGTIGEMLSTPAEDGKGVHVKNLVARFNATYENSYAVGDSRSDAQMLELVENPIAFNPDRNLFTLAQENRWKIVLERKNVIYELENTDGTYLLA